MQTIVSGLPGKRFIEENFKSVITETHSKGSEVIMHERNFILHLHNSSNHIKKAGIACTKKYSASCFGYKFPCLNLRLTSVSFNESFVIF